MGSPGGWRLCAGGGTREGSLRVVEGEFEFDGAIHERRDRAEPADAVVEGAHGVRAAARSDEEIREFEVRVGLGPRSGRDGGRAIRGGLLGIAEFTHHPGPHGERGGVAGLSGEIAIEGGPGFGKFSSRRQRPPARQTGPDDARRDGIDARQMRQRRLPFAVFEILHRETVEQHGIVRLFP